MKKIVIISFCLITLVAIFHEVLIDAIRPSRYTISIDMSPQKDHPEVHIACFGKTYYIFSPSIKEFQRFYNQCYPDPESKSLRLHRNLKATNIWKTLRRDFHLKEGMSHIKRYSDDAPLGLEADLFIKEKKLFINLRFYEEDVKLSYLPAKNLGITSFEQWADFLDKHPDPQVEELRNIANTYQGEKVIWRGNHGTYCENILPGLYIFCIHRKRMNCYDTIAFMLEFSLKFDNQ